MDQAIDDTLTQLISETDEITESCSSPKFPGKTAFIPNSKFL